MALIHTCTNNARLVCFERQSNAIIVISILNSDSVFLHLKQRISNMFKEYVYLYMRGIFVSDNQSFMII